MKILILTQYFPPETGAPQNRLSDLALRLKNKGIEVTVLTTMPNYPEMKIHQGYKKKLLVKEKWQNIPLYRSSIYVTQKRSIFFRLLNYFSFVMSSMFTGLFRIKKHDYVLCESPPLFLGISARTICFFKRSKLIFNVSDLWPESAEKLGLVKSKTFLKLAYWLEKRLYKKSYLVTCQTQGIEKSINKRFPNVKTHWLPNGVDPSLFDLSTSSAFRKEHGFSETDFLFLYAGIFGHAQGLEVILKAAKKIKQEHVRFIIMGEGPEKAKLHALKEELRLTNVFFISGVSKNQMPSIIKGIDATIIPLKKLDLFLGAIPSKIFENLAMKKPLILGVDGEARELFIEKGNAGLYFEPENEDDLVTKINTLANDVNLVNRLGENGHQFVFKYFNRENIANDFISKITT